MKISHDGREYEFDMDSLEAHELRAVEQHTGMTFPEWGEGLQRGKVDALVAVVFTAKRRAGDDLEWSDLDNLNVPELMVAMAEVNGLDAEAIARGETPDVPESPLAARLRQSPKVNSNNGATKRPPAKRAAARK